MAVRKTVLTTSIDVNSVTIKDAKARDAMRIYDL